MTFFQPLLIALALLTRIPVPEKYFPSKTDTALLQKSVLWYPVVGLILAGGISLIPLLMANQLPPLLTAALTVVIWVLLTGALHLDGLSDCVDASYAGHKNPDVIDTVLKDPHTGTMGIVAICLTLIVKVCLLHALLGSQTLVTSGLFIALVWSRFLAVVYILATPYARETGASAGLRINGYRYFIIIMGLVLVVSTVFVTTLAFVLALVSTLGVWLLWWQHQWIKKIGGYTGDCVGALIEIAELATLLVAVLVL